jgi:hypothetical protein
VSYQLTDTEVNKVVGVVAEVATTQQDLTLWDYTLEVAAVREQANAAIGSR